MKVPRFASPLCRCRCDDCGICFGLSFDPDCLSGIFGEVEAVHTTHFNVELRGADLVMSLLNGKFKATYYKPPNQPHLILRERTRTDDHEMVDEAFRTAVAKARELGWIVRAASVRRATVASADSW